MHDKIDGYHVVGEVYVYQSLTKVEMNMPMLFFLGQLRCIYITAILMSAILKKVEKDL